MSAIERLLTIMKTLRDPEGGCPWDIAQNFQSIAPYTLEEAYEVVDAIERADYDELLGELGDLLLQVVFHSQMADELGLFDFADVVAAICDKMEQRHPHVFGNGSATTAEEVRKTWASIKNEERGERSVLSDIPAALPALKKAQKLGARAGSVGFDWQEVAGAVDKLQEELDELLAVLPLSRTGQMEQTEHEIGDVLFSVVNVCRHLKVDAEGALNKANRRFVERFGHVEQMARQYTRETGIQADLEFMERHWQEAKKIIKT